jgi:hypothetical protein
MWTRLLYQTIKKVKHNQRGVYSLHSFHVQNHYDKIGWQDGAIWQPAEYKTIAYLFPSVIIGYHYKG